MIALYGGVGTTLLPHAGHPVLPALDPRRWWPERLARFYLPYSYFTAFSVLVAGGSIYKHVERRGQLDAC
jgi:hypothetical protein